MSCLKVHDLRLASPVQYTLPTAFVSSIIFCLAKQVIKFLIQITALLNCWGDANRTSQVNNHPLITLGSNFWLSGNIGESLTISSPERDSAYIWLQQLHRKVFLAKSSRTQSLTWKADKIVVDFNSPCWLSSFLLHTLPLGGEPSITQDTSREEVLVFTSIWWTNQQ